MNRFFLVVISSLFFVSLQAKCIVVTGGAGLIGSHLCKRLLEKEHDVICVDNLSSGNSENINRIIYHPKFQFIKQDICKPIEINAPIDEIYHLACPASPVYYQVNPIQTLDTNYIGTKNILELAKSHGAKFLHTSTSEVYGDPLVHPQREEYFGNVNPNGIRACYDEGKRVAEALIFSYRDAYNLDVKIVRIFNTYGPNMNSDDGRVVSNFIVQALNDEPITVYGDGKQTRSLCYVDDMIKGLTKMMAQPQGCSGPINLGNPNEMTILELAEKIISMTGSKSQIRYMPLPQDDPVKRRPDITKAEQILGWRPETNVDEGLRKTISYFKSLQESVKNL